MIAWDTETFLIAPTLLAPQLVCVSWARPDGSSGLVHHKRAESFIEGILREPMVGANIPFDLGVVGQKWPHFMPLIFDALDADDVFDVQTTEKLLDIARGSYRWDEDDEGNVTRVGYTLKRLTKKWLGIELEKDEFRMRYHDFHHLPLHKWPKGARKYAIDDAISTLGVWQKQQPLAGKYCADQHAQVRAHWALHLMSAWGIKTDQAAVKRLEKRVTEEIESIVDELVDEGLVRSDRSRDTKFAKNRMFQLVMQEKEDTIDLAFITKTGIDLLKEGALADPIAAANMGFISLSQEACQLIDDPVLLKYSRYTQLQNLLRKDVQELSAGTIVPIQSYFEVLMESGRTSSSRPNVQNLRREPGVRECFIPRDGCVFVAADFSSAELVSLAQICIDLFGKSQLANALNGGLDPHLWMAAHIIGITYEEALRRYKEEDEAIIEARQMAKAANFGFPGGLGIKRFVAYAKAMKVDLTHDFAGRLKRMWLETWPEMKWYFEWMNRDFDNDGNRKRDSEGWSWFTQPRSGRIRGKMSYTQACNTPFQGMSADGAKAAMVEVTRQQWCEPESALYGSALINFVHDELIAECWEEDAHDVAMAMCDIMKTEYNKFTPDVPVKVDPVVMRYWSKKAKQVWKNGRLVPWGPKLAA